MLDPSLNENSLPLASDFVLFSSDVGRGILMRVVLGKSMLKEDIADTIEEEVLFVEVGIGTSVFSP